MTAVDKYTVRVVTKQPTASLLEYLFDRFIITGKDLYEKYGARDADRKYLWGWGPYKLKELEIGQRIVLERDPANPEAKPENPDTLIFTIMREPEQRVTALLNNEIQIAEFIPPQLAPRVREVEERQGSRGQLGRDHVSGDESQIQAMGQSQASAGRVLCDRPRFDHQEHTRRAGRPARRSDRTRAVRLRPGLREAKSLHPLRSGEGEGNW